MNIHCTEDELLKCALGVLSGRDNRRVREHTGSCPQCAAALKVVDGSLEALAQCDPVISMDVPDLAAARERVRTLASAQVPYQRQLGEGSGLRRGNRLRLLIRFAAVLCIGIGIGYEASDLTRQPEPTVVRQLVVPRRSTREAGEFVSCNANDLDPARRASARRTPLPPDPLQ
jgi:hypothetical protein